MVNSTLAHQYKEEAQERAYSLLPLFHKASKANYLKMS